MGKLEAPTDLGNIKRQWPETGTSGRSSNLGSMLVNNPSIQFDTVASLRAGSPPTHKDHGFGNGRDTISLSAMGNLKGHGLVLSSYALDLFVQFRSISNG